MAFQKFVPIDGLTVKRPEPEYNEPAIKRGGRLEVICGPMFSGKSEELIRRIMRAELGNKEVVVLQPSVDTRFAPGVVTSHNGRSVQAVVVADLSQFDNIGLEVDVIAIDEVQFFEEGIVDTIMDQVEYGRIVIVSGLDMTYRQEPFGCVPELMARADSVTKLSAVCQKCGDDAMYTQRLVDGSAAPFAGETILVGGTESYEARCRSCFERA